jgi:hypothetical protein
MVDADVWKKVSLMADVSIPQVESNRRLDAIDRKILSVL